MGVGKKKDRPQGKRKQRIKKTKRGKKVIKAEKSGANKKKGKRKRKTIGGDGRKKPLKGIGEWRNRK